MSSSVAAGRLSTDSIEFRLGAGLGPQRLGVSCGHYLHGYDQPEYLRLACTDRSRVPPGLRCARELPCRRVGSGGAAPCETPRQPPLATRPAVAVGGDRSAILALRVHPRPRRCGSRSCSSARCMALVRAHAHLCGHRILGRRGFGASQCSRRRTPHRTKCPLGGGRTQHGRSRGEIGQGWPTRGRSWT